MKNVTQETERTSWLISCVIMYASCHHPPKCDNASLCQIVFTALCSSFLLKYGSFTRCESLLHNKYRKGVLLCVCEMWQLLLFVHTFLFFCYLTHLYRAAWVSVMNNFFHTYFLYMLEFFLALSFIPLTHKTSFSNLTAWWVKDEATWRIVWKAQCDTSFYGILHLGLIPASCLLTSKHASVRVRVLVFCWSQGYHFLLLQSVPSPMAKF